MTFTIDNTEGYTAADLAILNEALEILVSSNPDVDEKNLSDAIHNAWIGGQDAEELATASGFYDGDD